MVKRPKVETWSEFVRAHMRLREKNQRQLSLEWEISTAVMSNWVGKGTRPSLPNVIKVHEKSGEPLERLLRAARYISLDVETTSEYPPWLREKLDQLTNAELAVVAETAHGLLRLREESGGYEAAPTPQSPNPRATRKQPPARPSG